MHFDHCVHCVHCVQPKITTSSKINNTFVYLFIERCSGCWYYNITFYRVCVVCRIRMCNVDKRQNKSGKCFSLLTIRTKRYKFTKPFQPSNDIILWKQTKPNRKYLFRFHWRRNEKDASWKILKFIYLFFFSINAFLQFTLIQVKRLTKNTESNEMWKKCTDNRGA